MPVVAAIASIVGAGVAVAGDIISANDQSSLDQTRAQVAEQQAAELAAREQDNEAIRAQTAVRQKLQFGASYAASGKAGVGIGSQLQIQSQSDLQSMISNRETQFQELMLQQQAGIDTTLAGQTQEAGAIGAVGAGLGGLSNAAGIVARNPGAFGLGGRSQPSGINGGG